MSDDEMRAALATFVNEARDLVRAIEEGLLGLEDSGADSDAVNALFRAVHTVKGSAGLFGIDHLVAFAHVVETVLDTVRDGALAVTPDLVSDLLPCADHISALIEAVAAGQLEATPDDLATGEQLLARLRPYLSGPVDAVPAAQSAVARDGARTWQLSLRFGPDCLRNGMDPLAFVRYLCTLGTVEHVATLTDTLPPADELDPETCYLGFLVRLRTTATEPEIASVFEFVRADSEIRIEPVGGEARTVETARKPRKGGEPRPADTQTIRVDAARLDKLIDLVGELVIAQAGVTARTSTSDSGHLMEAQAEVLRLVEEVRHSALSLRMVPIGMTLRRFERVIRDVCLELDKEVDLVVTGGDAEMDKAMVERIGDPLLHIVRNALDHGMESRPERVRRGKPTRGTIHLNAYHDAGCIVIEVTDDGRGLDRDRILAKAVERGLIDQAAVLTDQEVYQLIFEPGFSTAETVSNLSGRGVGMDVVRRNVTALRGTIEIESTPGAGTTIRIRLPLTLAIIDGFLVGVGSSAFVIPLDRVTECMELPESALRRDRINLRGQVLPLIRLRSVFQTPELAHRRQSVVVVEQSGQRTGLVVDVLMGQFQTVIKPLGVLFSHLKWISGATILGNGDMALILDVGALVADHADRALAPAA